MMLGTDGGMGKKKSAPEADLQGIFDNGQIINNERRGNISVTWMRSIDFAGERNPAGAGTKPQDKNTPMKIRNPRTGAHTQGFTLIELLVVISIIAILAGFALPVFTSAQKKGRITDSLSNCKQVNLALRMYSGDNDGIFPNTAVAAGGTAGVPLATGDFSNKAFENLMPKYSTSKKIFGNKGSAYCKTSVPDTLTDSNNIKKGQNDWMYILGLSDTSDARWPLIATATKSASDLTYTNISTEKGGVWAGTDALIGFCDGSARPVSGKEMDTATATATFVKCPIDPSANMFKGTDEWLGKSSVVLIPE